MAKKTKKRIVERHKILLKTVSDNIRNGMSMEQAMIKVGYTKSYAKTSTRLKETDSWKKLVDEKLSDEKLTKVHEGLLKHKEWRARDAGLDKAYKIKKRYGADITINHKFNEFSDEELEGEIAGEVSEVIGAIAGKEKKSGK